MKEIRDVSEQLNDDLQQYLESTYHLSHPRLLRERRALMDDGETATEPWVEATPSYVYGDSIRDLGLPEVVADLLKDLEADGLDVYDPPYQHQADALQSFFNDEQDLVVSTGTGSGKTEIFLYSILGQLAKEAARGTTTDQRGIRTLILYPMNALVADQLSRMRLLFGDNGGANTIEQRMDRRVQFGMYTSRTPYHGPYDVDKNDTRLKPIINRYLDLKENRNELYRELDEKGRVPAKNLEGFRNRNHARESQFRTQPGDRELLTRQEMHSPNEYGGTPDLLITNYSMLEYMLLRPIEQPLFEDTREWLASDADNELNIVLDEAHLYRGAQGAEVALLISRLLQKLGISRDRVRFILTSATMGNNIEEAAPEFAAELTTGEPEEFALITGEQTSYGDGRSSDERAAEILSRIGYSLEESKLRNLASERGWDKPNWDTDEDLKNYLAGQLEEDPLFQLAHEHLREDPLPLADLAEELFPGVGEDIASDATGNLLYLCTEARKPDGRALLPTRLHMFLKGLPAQYACVNPECDGRQATEGENLLGRFYTNPHTTCPECGSRVFELLSHRTCGAAYLRAYRRSGDTRGPTFLWTNPENSDDLEELHLLVEEPRNDSDPEHDHGRSLSETTPSRNLDISSGHLLGDQFATGDDSQYITVWMPTEEPPDEDAAWSWTRCPACGIQEQRRHGNTKIQDLVTKGEEPFANIVRSMFGIQPADDRKADLPNKGKKVLCFSDGRQKAARLARDLQSNVELDSFREVMAAIVDRYDGELTMEQFFAQFAVYCDKHNIVFFDDSDEYTSNQGVEYRGSRTHFEQIQGSLDDIANRYSLDSVDEIPDHPMARKELADRPRQFDQTILRSIGDEYYSIAASLVGYLRPTDAVLDAITQANPSLDAELVESILIEALTSACEDRFFDPSISSIQRSKSLAYGWMSEEEVGVEYDELIPDYIKETLGDTVSESEWQTLVMSLVDTNPTLFEPVSPGKFVVNPAATTIELRVTEDWYRCEGCRQFAAVSLDGVCPREDCSGHLETVGDEDIHLQARKNFLRNPPQRVVNENRDPFTLRSEEHSAQLSAKDFSEPFSRSEIYELLFQDILVGDTDVEQPIDVLSCTTTMEVGIDIGSLTGVAMRTVPPAPENYEQRAGRAGRRGVGLSTIITFADNSPHESHYFDNPELMVGGEGTEPIIYSGNEKIAQRHINASLLARFFDPSEFAESSDVFRSLGTASEFFGNNGAHSFGAFEGWVQEEVLVPDSDIVEELGTLLPDALGEELSGDWRTEFVQTAAAEFIENLRELQERTTWTETDEEDSDLLSTLLDDALLPTFSFPTDVCDFIVRGADADSGHPKTKYEMSRDLKQALSTYAPGREIVVDKKTYESYGVYFRFTDDPNDRATTVDWDDLDWLNFCRRCETILDERDENLAEQEMLCPVCEEEEISAVQMFTPPAFAPEVDQAGQPEQASGYSEERVYATPPKYPLTPTPADASDQEMLDEKTIGPSRVGRLNDEQLLVANFGPDDEGFDICTKCGAVGRSGGLSNPHNRPYPKDIRHMDMSEWTNQCSGSVTRASFSHSFPSDLTVFRIPLREPMEFVPNADWFESAAQSLAEALVMGASRSLGIEDQELEGGFRTRSADLGPEDDARGFIEIFLFDTTSGGAGFSSKVWDEFDTVLEEARSILADCDCATACHSCLRRYQNRHLHETLSRHQGLALLQYATTGTPPELTELKIDGLVTQLERALQLQNDAVSIESTDERDVWQATLDGRTLTFGVRSSLRGDRTAESSSLDRDYSDHDLTVQLPEVAYEVLDTLE